MSLSLLFWILMLLWLLLGGYRNRTSFNAPNGWSMWGGDLFLFILLLILGWQIFGQPIR